MTTLILGVGSPIHGDDLGWRVVEALAEAPCAPLLDRPGTRLATCDRPGPLLVERIEGMAQVILIDAMCAGLTPGSVRLLRPEDLATGIDGYSSHGVGVADALALAHAVGALPPRLDLIGIEVGEEAVGLPGQPLPEGIMREVCDLVARLLRGSV